MLQIKTLSIILILQFLYSCSSPTPGSDSTSDTDDSSSSNTSIIIESDELFVSDGTGMTFSTDTIENGSSNGASYWTEVLPAADSFIEINVEMSKKSGSGSGGFGVFFSQLDTDSSSFSALTTLLNVNGEHCVGLIEGSSFSYLKDWTSDAAITANYNVSNSIKITKASGKYSITVNGTLIYEFEDDSIPVHDGGGYGYIAVVSSLENFPSEAVEVYFETIP